MEKTVEKITVRRRYYNACGYAIAIVASITKDIDWVAYIGADDGMRLEIETVEFVLGWGCKLSEKDARYYFPDIELPYRG